MPRPLLCLLAVATISVAGCGSEPPVSAGPAQPPATGTTAPFDKTTCGTLTGLVTWIGPAPNVPPLSYNVPKPDGNGFEARVLAQANTPKVNFATRGTAGAVVYLRGVDSARARPWDLLDVRVEIRDAQIAVIQGERTARTGFVRRGASVSMQSADPELHNLRGRGAAFFALPFPEPNKPLVREFSTAGRVELTSAAGFYWQAADLFVCDHPYYALSDDDGRFRFDLVPAGQYELVVWHPNWVIERFERNPESGQPSRQYYAPAFESSRTVTVSPGRTALANLTLPK